MESGFEDDFAPLQSGSNGTETSAPTQPNVASVTPAPAPAEDAAFILDQPETEESPKKISDADAGDDPSSTASSDLSLSVSKHVEPREEPEVIKQWKENQVKMLERKDEEEEKSKEALKEQAKKELEDWYKQHSEQLSKLQTANRAASIS